MKLLITSPLGAELFRADALEVVVQKHTRHGPHSTPGRPSAKPYALAAISSGKSCISCNAARGKYFESKAVMHCAPELDCDHLLIARVS